MSTPQQPDPWGQAWSDGSQAPHGPGEDPQTAKFTAQHYPTGAESAQYYETPPPPYYGNQGYAPQPNRTPPWAWVLLGVVIVVLLGGLGYFVATKIFGADDLPAASSGTQSDGSASDTPPAVTASPRPSPPPSPAPSSQVSIPANALSCPVTVTTAEFSSSAVVGNTSCPFAEEVRMAYLQQSARNANVSVRAWSPTTKKTYTMSCRGDDVVVCTGGNNAAVYIY